MLQNFGRIKEKLLFAVPLRSSERKHNFIRVSRSPQMAYRLDFSQSKGISLAIKNLLLMKVYDFMKTVKFF